MNRRSLLAGAAALVLHPAGARAQKARTPTIGFISSTLAAPLGAPLSALKAGLRQEGFVEGETVAIEYRWAENQYDRLPEMAADLVSRQVSLIVAAGGTITPLIAKGATTTIPIVFTGVSDPVNSRLVESLSRPGANVTGVSILGIELDAKRLELMALLAPQRTPIGVLVNPGNPATDRQIEGLRAAADVIGRELVLLPAAADGEVSAAFSQLVARGGRAILAAADPLFVGKRELIVAEAARHALPAIYQWRDFVEVGGLMSYGPSLEDAYRQAGQYAGRILKGERPADLPVFQSARIELVLNITTAKSLGLTFPQTILLRADEVIE